jgi:uncharacterized protein (TIGR03089 family)
MVHPTPSLPGLLPAALAHDPARPLVTFYDDATGERVELSVATFDNWVAKTANLLVDELGADPGARVLIDLPLHWQTAVWVGACWAAGTVPVLATVAGDQPAVDGADVLVCGPALPDPLPRVPEVVALALRPLGGRFVDPLPGGVLDYAVAVPSHGDRFAPRADADDAGLVVGDRTLSGEDVVTEARALAARWELDQGGRLLSTLGPSSLDGALAMLAVPLVVGGSVVLVRNPDPAAAQRRVQDERVSATAG